MHLLVKEMCDKVYTIISLLQPSQFSPEMFLFSDYILLQPPVKLCLTKFIFPCARRVKSRHTANVCLSQFVVGYRGWQ
jgi:hypothetical protein